MSVFSSLDRKTSKQEIKFPKDFFSVHIMSHLTCYQLAHRESFALGLCLLLLHALLKQLRPHHIPLSTDSHSLLEQLFALSQLLFMGSDTKDKCSYGILYLGKCHASYIQFINHYAKCFMLSTKNRLQREMNYSKSKSITGKERRVVSQAC